MSDEYRMSTPGPADEIAEAALVQLEVTPSSPYFSYHLVKEAARLAALKALSLESLEN